MPWNMQDYPDALKNFDDLTRKKIIDIANAMEASGYEEDDLIPIAINQGKEWANSASKEEKDAFSKEKNPSKNDDHDTSGARPDLADNDVEVRYDNEEAHWYVKTVGADQATETFDTKEEAVDRAKEIAENRETKVIRFTQDGKRQD